MYYPTKYIWQRITIREITLIIDLTYNSYFFFFQSYDPFKVIDSYNNETKKQNKKTQIFLIY